MPLCVKAWEPSLPQPSSPSSKIYRLQGKSGNLAVKPPSSVKLTFDDLSFSTSSGKRLQSYFIYCLDVKKKKKFHLCIPPLTPLQNQKMQNPVCEHKHWQVAFSTREDCFWGLFFHRKNGCWGKEQGSPISDGLPPTRASPAHFSFRKGFPSLSMLDQLKRKRVLSGTIITRLFQTLYKYDSFLVLWLIRDHHEQFSFWK